MNKAYHLLQIVLLVLALAGGVRLFLGRTDSAGMAVGCLALSLLCGLLGGDKK